MIYLFLAGYIFVSVELQSEDETSVELKFTCEDTGIGINQDNHKKIFEPFVQVDNGSDRLYDGVGLGLSICVSIMKALNGRIWVESELNKGSRFYFVLPLQKVETSKTFQLSHQLPTSVICIEPHELHRNVLSRYLTNLGCNFAIGTKLEEGLTLIQKELTLPIPPSSLTVLIKEEFQSLIADINQRIADNTLPNSVSIRWISLANNFGNTNSSAINSCLFRPIRFHKLVDILSNKRQQGKSPSISHSASSLQQQQKVEKSPESKLQILCVDDNDMNAKILIRMLKKLHYETDRAENGQVALEKMKSKDYALVLMVHFFILFSLIESILYRIYICQY